jgi:hypothetical protein
MAATVSLGLGALPAPAIAAPGADRNTAATAPTATAPDAVPERDRAAVIGPKWETSTDRAWLATGDADGFHLMVADAADGYRWTTIASLSEPGLPADRWIGNACVTGSGTRAVVVYAPRTFTNDPELMRRGGFTAVVDLGKGTVTKLSVQSSLAYFNPGCGAGETAVLTQDGGEDLGRTRLIELDAATGRTDSRIEVAGQLTSPVPTQHGIVAADSGALVRVAKDGTRRVLAPAKGVPFKLAADRDGGVVFMERAGTDRTAVRRATTAPVRGSSRASSVTTVATGPLTEVDVSSSMGGRVFVTGRAKAGAPRPASVSVLDVPVRTKLSMQGGLAVTAVREARPRDLRTPLAIDALVPGTGRKVAFTALPAEAEFGEQGETAGRNLSPSVKVAAGARVTASDPHDPADFDDRYCSVPRADPRNQAMQPKPRQVEWAVDQAITNSLTVQRPEDWKNLGMPAYTPQGLFPPRSLVGGGRVPAQVFLGIIAQESNLWQASRHAVPGVTSNPLIGNYFGLDIYNSTPSDDWDINWAKADCGYGVSQVTDGMRLAGREKPGEVALPYQAQRAVALDFAANVAAGLRILQGKWNQTRSAGLMVNNGDPAKIENWFFAVWAYNSGFHPRSQADQNSGAWGVGWANNPVNPHYPANRDPFLEFTYADAAHPQDWPYPEKVMGWAGHPVEILEAPDQLVAGFRAAWWNGGDIDGPLNRQRVKPPITQFCDVSDHCLPGERITPDDPEVIGEPAGPCAHHNGAGLYDLKCWYNQPSTWKTDCSYSCGNEVLRFDPGYGYQDDGAAYPPRCTLDGLPSGALVVDDVPDGVPSVRPGCGRPWTNQGTFQFTFKPDARGRYPGKIDTHQIGGGFGGHFWFTHTRTAADEGGKMEVSARWRLDRSHTGPMRILVALPDQGAHTHQASYVVKTSRGDRVRVLKQPGDGNRWISLGAFMFDNVPEVTLSSVTPDGSGVEDIAFDAVAFVPIQGTYHEQTVEAVALFDEDQNLDTAAPESWLGGNLASRQALYDWAIDRSQAILEMPACDSMVGDCLTPDVGAVVRNWRAEVQAAGTDPVNHPDGTSMARWMGFANSYLDRPTTTVRPASFDDDARYKIRTKVTVSYVTDSALKIVPGSEYTEYGHRTADAHLPRFAVDLIRAVVDDYAAWGVDMPDLSYRLKDLNVKNGMWTSANPTVNGALPGQAYAYAGKAPVLTDYAGTVGGADCVAALVTAGGAIGYRPMLSQSGPTDAMEAFVDQLDDDRIADPVEDLVEDLRRMFFDPGLVPGVDASLFTVAPPIWQELNLRVCADGSVREVAGGWPILRSSWMPDQYLYLNDLAMKPDGTYSGAITPVTTGDFVNFSKSPFHDDTPYGQCGASSGRSGNPWSIDMIDGPGHIPSEARFCLDPSLPADPSHSS